ncbi:MAG TPA: xanthine dehydrogenase family protein molybdopterin-binding subunit [Dongiaceae bacterium]|jgi:carbon-monoxide dehydrogenase large subunit
MADETAAGRFGSGREVRRIEDRALLLGAGRFTDDVSLPGQLHLCFLRSPHAHAKLTGIDAGAARAMPGVVAVLTGADLQAAGVKPQAVTSAFKHPDGGEAATPFRPALALERVRFVGEAVAAVIAETRAQAKDALEAITVDYEELPAVTGLAEAVAPNAPQIWPAATGNIVARSHFGDAAAAEAAFEAAAHVVSLHLVNQRLAPTPMEPRSTLASHDTASGRLTLHLSSQMPSSARDALAAALEIPPADIRVVVGDVGGGFGVKTGLYPEDIVAAFASRLLKRPVKWAAERIEEFLSAFHGRGTESRAELALDGEGKVLAYRVRSLCDMGAYAGRAGIVIQLLIGPWVATSIYDIRTIDLEFTAVLTNAVPTSAYRGAGRPEAIYLIERMFDAAAIKLGLDPIEIRRRNLIHRAQMPYTNIMDQTYDDGDFARIIDQAVALADWAGFAAREAESRGRRKLRGRGVASFLEWTGANIFEERATVAVMGTGEIEIYSTTMPMGQGIATSFAQLVVDVFGVPIEKIRIVQGDSDRGSGFGSAASRSLFTAGSAIRQASEKTIATARDLAADALETSSADIEYREGIFRIAGTDREIGLFALADAQPDRRIYIDMMGKVDGPSWPNACHICEVEIDPETGHLGIASYVSVNDIGKVVNPLIVRGQLDGGAVQGIGQTLQEQIVYDDSGQLITGSFMDYTMPRAGDVGAFHHVLDQSVPCHNNPLGAKGVGELGTIGATPALMNAAVDAIVRAGYPERAYKLQMPLTPEKLWRAINNR